MSSLISWQVNPIYRLLWTSILVFKNIVIPRASSENTYLFVMTKLGFNYDYDYLQFMYIYIFKQDIFKVQFKPK